MKNTNSFLNCINNSFYLLILLLIPSCASFNTTETAEKLAPSFTYAYESIKNAVIGYPDLNITREIVENIPYASALLKVGKGPEGLVILESIENDNFKAIVTKQLKELSADFVYEKIIKEISLI